MSDLNKVYWAGIEYLYKQQHPQYSELRGGFVYAFVYTEDARSFLKKIQPFFNKEKLEIVRVEFINIYDKKMQWGKIEDGKKYKNLIKEAELTSEVVLDDFYAYNR